MHLVSHMTNCISSESVHSVHTSNWWSSEPGCHCIKLLHTMTDLRKNLILSQWHDSGMYVALQYHYCWDTWIFGKIIPIRLWFHTIIVEMQWHSNTTHRVGNHHLSGFYSLHCTEVQQKTFHDCLLRHHQIYILCLQLHAQCAATSAPLQVYMTRILVTKYHLMKKRSTFYNHNSLSFSTVLVEWYRPDWLNCGSHNCHFSSLWL